VSTFTVVIAEAPYGQERPYTTLRFVMAALNAGHSVNLFVLEDAVCMAKKGQAPAELPGLLEQDKMPKIEEMLASAIKQGAIVRLCGVCCGERGLTQEELVDGAQIGSMRNLVDWAANGDKVMFF